VRKFSKEGKKEGQHSKSLIVVNEAMAEASKKKLALLLQK